MINDIAQEASAPKPDFKELVDQSMAEGVTGGILGFMRHNRVNLHPGKSGVKNPIADFASLLLAEYLPDPKDYPFKDSLKAALAAKLEEEKETINLLYLNGEHQNVVGYSRMVAGEAVAKFLEDNRIEVLKLILKIRGEK